MRLRTGWPTRSRWSRRSAGSGGDVRRLAAEGADVGFTYHTGQDGARTGGHPGTRPGRRVLRVQADLGKRAAAGAVVEAVVGKFGRLDILVNNAGITHWGALRRLGWRISTGSRVDAALRS